MVIGDGHQSTWVKKLVESYNYRYMTHGPTRDFGNSQRNFAYCWAHGDYILHLDDDDIFAEDAFLKIRKAIRQQPNRPLIFKSIAPWGEVVWRDKIIERGNTYTIMFAVPYKRGEMAHWPMRQGGDINFIQDTIALYSGKVGWRPEITTIARPLERWWEK